MASSTDLGGLWIATVHPLATFTCQLLFFFFFLKYKIKVPQQQLPVRLNWLLEQTNYNSANPKNEFGSLLISHLVPKPSTISVYNNTTFRTRTCVLCIVW